MLFVHAVEPEHRLLIQSYVERRVDLVQLVKVPLLLGVVLVVIFDMAVVRRHCRCWLLVAFLSLGVGPGNQ
jgi:hypothetical protein